jgi:uncharacterized membrane protein
VVAVSGITIEAKMTKILMTLVAGVLLSGCATLDGVDLSNRLACSVAKDELYVVSKYGPVGIANKIDDKDRQVVCK